MRGAPPGGTKLLICFPLACVTAPPFGTTASASIKTPTKLAGTVDRTNATAELQCNIEVILRLMRGFGQISQQICQHVLQELSIGIVHGAPLNGSIQRCSAQHIVNPIAPLGISSCFPESVER